MSVRVSPERSVACPGLEELRAFNMGRLPPEQSETVAGHLDGCPRCLTTLDSLDDDSDFLVHLLRCPILTELIGSEACQAVLSKLDTAELPPAEPETGSYVPRSSADAGSLPTGWGDYRVLEKLGQGGMGAVYKAVHTRLGKVVAVKVLPADRVADPRAVARFHREMEAVGALEHPNLVRALDAREEAGVHLLVMEYLEGTDLGRFLYRLGPLPVAAACEVVRQAAVGLQYAHDRFGLVHRDLKPSNLMLTPDGTVKVLDLGLARLAQSPENGPKPGAADLTSADECLGTYDYMAPEQWLEPSAVDIRADIYSLGCTLFQLLSGRLPYGGPEYDTPGKKMRGHADHPLPPWLAFRSDIPAGLHAVLERMTAKEPARRFATPAEVAEALRPFCAGHDLLALLRRDRGPSEPAPKPAAVGRIGNPPSQLDRQPASVSPHRRPRRRVAAVGALVGLVMLIGIPLWAVYHFLNQPVAPGDSSSSHAMAPTAEDLPVSLPRIRHYRRMPGADGKISLYLLGQIGDPSTDARLNDRVKVEVAFGTPVYPYLVAINPDGTPELLFPEDQGRPPAPRTQLTYPTELEDYAILDAPGLVCFVLLAARQPLPPFTEWRPLIDGLAWNAAQPSVPWSYDGHTLAPLMVTRVGKVQDGPKPLADLCRFFQSCHPGAAVRAVAFTVRQEPLNPGGGKP